MSIVVDTFAVIDSPPKAVFDALTDVAHQSKWARGSVKIQNLSQNPVKLGSTWHQSTRLLGEKLEGDVRANIFEPNHRFGYRSEKPAKEQYIYTLAPDGDETKLTFTIDLEPDGLFNQDVLVISNSLRETMSKDIDNLKARLESQR
jgi:uncharacterized protein YndB with AHSA1/START domain